MNSLFKAINKRFWPSIGRFIELSIISACVYILWAISYWQALSMQVLSQTMLVPIIAALSKRQRDLSEKIQKDGE